MESEKKSLFELGNGKKGGSRKLGSKNWFWGFEVK